MRTLLINICLFTIFIFYTCTTNAQSHSLKIDSLKKVLLTEKEDTNKVKTLCALSYLYINYDLKEALQNVSFALAISKKINYKFGIANCYLSMGGIYTNLDNRSEALPSYYAALTLFEEMGKKIQAAACLTWIGFNYFEMENYTESFTAFSRSLQTIQESGIDRKDLSAGCYIYLAKIFLLQNNITKAFEYNSTGLKVAIEINNKQLIANAYNCFGDIIMKRALTNSALNNDPSNSLKDALANYIKSKDNFKAVPDSGGLGDEYENIANVNIRLKNFAEAKKYIDSSFLCANVTHFKDNYERSFLIQSQLDSATGKYMHAFNSYKKYILYRDSIIIDQNKKKTLQTSMQYDFDKKATIAKAAQDKKDADTQRIKNQQYFVITALGVVVVAALVITLIQFKNNKQKQKANNLITQQKQQVEATLSELKSAQRQLIQSEKMASLGELTAGIAHEIQNPLNFVNNFSEVSKELLAEMKVELDKGNTEDAKEIANDVISNLEKINIHGKRADNIVKGMLEHSRTSNKSKEPTDINKLADEYLRLAYHGLRSKDKSFNATLNTDFDKTTGNINIIPQDIGRVLLNLYTNAFYAVNEKKKQLGDGFDPVVSVSTRLVGKSVEIKVTDNGHGVPVNVVDKIFQPFFTTKPTGQGTGLGLSLSYDIIKAHQGEIKIINKPREGAEFVIQLPI